MPAQDTSGTKEKILYLIRTRGPSFPARIASETGLSMLFASAFLSELLSEKKLKLSHMKVGSSPVYLIPGQEPKLEEFSKHLKSKEKDAFTILKENKFLIDKEQEPAIRVALRAIKDFAIPFQKNNEIIWRYLTIEESEFTQKENSKIEPKVIETPQIPESRKQEIKKSLDKQEEEEEEEEAIPKKKTTSKPKPGEKSEFVAKVLRYIESSKINLLEETEIRKKEFAGIGRIESDLGETEIMIVAKDKKKITKKDLEDLLKKVKEGYRTILFLSEGEIETKSKDAFRECKHLIKFIRL